MIENLDLSIVVHFKRGSRYGDSNRHLQFWLSSTCRVGRLVLKRDNLPYKCIRVAGNVPALKYFSKKATIRYNLTIVYPQFYTQEAELRAAAFCFHPRKVIGFVIEWMHKIGGLIRNPFHKSRQLDLYAKCSFFPCINVKTV